jgi:hypothetical protein
VTTTPGYVAGSTSVILDVQLIAATTSSYYDATVKINGFNAVGTALTNSFAADVDTNQLIIPLTTTNLSIVVANAGPGAGNNRWNLSIRVIGFIG